MGQYSGSLGELKVQVAFDADKKTITISDNGLGMTADEIKKYINQIAFSGAEEFVEKFKDAKDANELIGKFGLGFYSAFMVADQVEIQTLSYQDGAAPARWICDGSTEFEISEGARAERAPTLSCTSIKIRKSFWINTSCRGYWINIASSCPYRCSSARKRITLTTAKTKMVSLIQNRWR